MAMINREGLNGRDDFIGFTFKGRHSSEFNIIQVSKSSRMGKELLPSPKDISIQVAGVDGAYYFGSTYGTKKWDLNLAFNDLREEDFRAMQYWLADKNTGDLIFDEEPYKAWDVKITTAPKFNFICFNEEINGRVTRIYKGEGTVSFISYSIIAKAPFPFLEAYNYDYRNNKSGFDASAYDSAEKLRRVALNNTYAITSQYDKRLGINRMDPIETQILTPSTLDARLTGEDASVGEIGTQWYNFEQWYPVSRISTQIEMDMADKHIESIINGIFNPDAVGNEITISEGTYDSIWNEYKGYRRENRSTINVTSEGGTPSNRFQIPSGETSLADTNLIKLGQFGFRRYGYVCDTIFMEPDNFKREERWVCLDNSLANKYIEKYGTDIPETLINDDHRRKVTRYYDNPDDNSDVYPATNSIYCYGQPATYYQDAYVSNGGIGSQSYRVVDRWGSKIGPIRGIVGDHIHIYNPGNYKTYPKIIITVLDKRSMITRSRCNYSTAHCVYKGKNGNNENIYKYTIDALHQHGNYNWRYATFSIYPKYVDSPQTYEDADCLGRISLDLMKLVPENESRSNEAVMANDDGTSEDGKQIKVADGYPNQINYVIDSELKLIYAADVDTKPDLGWGPEIEGIVPDPHESYNTKITPHQFIKNEAIVAGDFFEIPPYELEEWNHKKIMQGRYILLLNNGASSVMGPYTSDKHWSSNDYTSDDSWIGQRVVWDINYL